MADNQEHQFYRRRVRGQPPVRVILDEPYQPEAPTHVSVYFAAHRQKPVCQLGFSLSTLPAIRTGVERGLNEGNLTPQLATMYMILYAKKYLRVRCTQTWSSFGVTIAAENTEIDALAPIEIIEGAEPLAGSDYPALDDPTKDDWMMLYIVLMYKLGPIQREDYKRIVVDRSKTLFASRQKTEGLNLLGNCPAFRGWSEHPIFCKVLAAIDMSIFKFRHEWKEFLFIRFGTHPSRFKDCGALNAFQYLAESLGVRPIRKLADWIFTERIADCFERILKDNEELGQEDSYMPYLRDLMLTPKSPYSTNANQELAFFVHVAGALLGLTWSKNAIMVYKSDLFTSEYCALLLAYAHRNKGDIQKIYRENAEDFDDDDPNLADAAEANQDTFLMCTTATEYCDWAISNRAAVHPLMEEYRRLRKSTLANSRPGTVGAYVFESIP